MWSDDIAVVDGMWILGGCPSHVKQQSFNRGKKKQTEDLHPLTCSCLELGYELLRFCGYLVITKHDEKSQHKKDAVQNRKMLLSHSVISNSFATQWTAACQASLSMKLSSQEYWSGLPCPSPGDFPNPGMEPVSPALQVDSLSLSYQGSPSAEIQE